MKLKSLIHLLRHELYTNRKGLLVWGVTIGGCAAMFASFGKLIVGNNDIVALLKSYPKALLDAFGFNLNAFTTFEGWMASEPFWFLSLLLGSFAGALGSSAIAREVDQKTGEFLFITPYSRREIFYSKAVSHFLQITAAAVAAAALTVIVGQLTMGAVNVRFLLLPCLAAYVASLSLCGIGYAITSVVNGERTALSIGVGVAIFSFLLNSLAGLDKSINWLAKLSVFHAFDAGKLAMGASFPVLGTLVLLAIYAGGMVLGAELLARKNLMM